MICLVFFLQLQFSAGNTLNDSNNPEGSFSFVEPYCEYSINPLGIDTVSPCFSWVLKSTERDQFQSAYRILVAGSRKNIESNFGDKWDSGKVISKDSVNIPYQGRGLSSSERCFWKVRCWDKAGRPSPWSRVSTFEMGLLNKSDWTGKWIGAGRRGTGDSLPYIPGKRGQGVLLDGRSQSIKIHHYPALKPDKEITISAFIKPDKRLGENWREVYRKDDGNARQLLAFGRTGDELGVWFGLGIGGVYTEHCAPFPADALKDGRWHMLAVVYNGKAKQIYVDGKLAGRTVIKGVIDTAGNSPAFIGSYNGVDEFFPGGIEDVRVYSSALSAGDIAALAQGKEIKAHPVGWWKLDGNLKNSVSGSDGEVHAKAEAPSSPLIRKEFTIPGKVKCARAYVSGIGWSELFINGKKIGDNVLDPATSDYDKRVFYVIHDVTGFLRKGKNAVGVMLGNGWFCEPGISRYGDSPRLLMRLDVELENGGKVLIKTDQTWKAAQGPVLYNSIWGGEIYDARLEKPGWNKPGYDDSNWDHVILKSSPGGKMVAQQLPPIKVRQTIKPVKITNPKHGVYLYDMGQLFGGWARLHVKGPSGTRVIVKYSARVFKDSGLIDKRRHNQGDETDIYILNGNPGGEIYEPRFTYHPVRYVQIEGYPGVPSINDLEGRVVFSAVDMSGDFACSNRLFNKIHKNVVWTLTNGLYGMPLDCLHREHWAWVDPATIAGSLYPRKYMPRFWKKWLRDIKGAQRADGAIPDVSPRYLSDRSDPAWGGNYPILAWYLYQYYDDLKLLKEHYDAMAGELRYLSSVATDHIIRKGHYGDHMLAGLKPGGEQFISKETPPPLVWTGYYYRDARVMSSAARVLGKPEDAKRYDLLAEDIKTAFNRRWFNQETKQYASGSQTANLFPLVLGIIPPADRRFVVKNIVKDIKNKYGGHLHAGNTGVTCMIDTLTAYGYGETLFDVVDKTSYPGWGYMVDQGATTVWEEWGLGNGAESMVMWLTVDEFFYNDIAGIKGPDYHGDGFMAPGFAEIEIRPHPLGDLKFARGSFKTVRGIISSIWQRKSKSFLLSVLIPVNCRARVSLPRIGLKDVQVREGGKTVWKKGRFIGGVSGIHGGMEEDTYITFKVGSGSYSFKLFVGK